MKRQLSLTTRLIFTAFVWVGLAIIATGIGLSTIFHRTFENSFDRQLAISLDALAASANIDATGKISVARPPTDPRFSRPLSGYYWRVTDVSAASIAPNPENNSAYVNEVHSRSLFDETILAPKDLVQKALREPGVTHSQDITRADEPLRIAVRIVKLPFSKSQTLLLVAGDRREISTSTNRFKIVLTLSLLLLAIGLLAAIYLQVSLGLRPLRKMGTELADIRSGKLQNLDEELPPELRPIAMELNALLKHNQAVVERARTHVGNLAHALKTPLSVMINESRNYKDSFSELVARQSETMSRQVEHYLKRARAAARAETLGVLTPIAPVAIDIFRTLGRLYKNDGVRLEIIGDTNLSFRGDREDLEDLIGNIAENACKYGGGTVELIYGKSENGFLEIFIDDDGDGLEPDEIKNVLKRGVRLDETSQGSGLGLSIALELANAYGGELFLERSSQGGLRVKFTLPVTDT